ncbi:hypothetical protein [Pontibacter sp. H249]|uniref:hypothetical protein n=1 Tax=Pontibacter sp. H249 TaxID=3133420 RepID=UPI0030BF165F
MKLITKFAGCLALLAAFTLASCEKEKLELNVVQVNGVTVTLTPQGGGETTSFTMSTPYTTEDGKVYGALKQDDIKLKPNTTYNATLTYFSDETGTRAEQNEIIKKEEKVYTVEYRKAQSNIDDMKAELAVVTTDKKADGSPLGLQATFTTGKAGIKTLHIDLKAEKRQGKSYMNGTVYNATFFIDVQN